MAVSLKQFIIWFNRFLSSCFPQWDAILIYQLQNPVFTKSSPQICNNLPVKIINYFPISWRFPLKWRVLEPWNGNLFFGNFHLIFFNTKYKVPSRCLLYVWRKYIEKDDCVVTRLRSRRYGAQVPAKAKSFPLYKNVHTSPGAPTSLRFYLFLFLPFFPDSMSTDGAFPRG